MSDENKFRASQGKFLTQSLFIEMNNTDEQAPYTLQTFDKTKNGVLVQSLHRRFVEMEDIGEFEFANKYLASYHHWLKLKAAPFFKEYYAAMVEELNAKMRSKSLKAMRAQVDEGAASQATLKYLADQDYDKKAPVGKPKRKKADKKEGNVIAADFERLQNK